MGIGECFLGTEGWRSGAAHFAQQVPASIQCCKAYPFPTVLLPLAALHPWHQMTISGSKCAICAANWHPPLEWGPWCEGSAPKEQHVIDAHAASVAHERWLPPAAPPPPHEILPPKDAPRGIPVPVQRATMNSYATIHADKGHKFYSRLCRLDGVKAKDGQRNYSNGYVV